jgi:hypothetical protein
LAVPLKVEPKRFKTVFSCGKIVLLIVLQRGKENNVI